jgi:hypothetical protein
VAAVVVVAAAAMAAASGRGGAAGGSKPAQAAAGTAAARRGFAHHLPPAPLLPTPAFQSFPTFNHKETLLDNYDYAMHGKVRAPGVGWGLLGRGPRSARRGGSWGQCSSWARSSRAAGGQQSGARAVVARGRRSASSSCARRQFTRQWGGARGLRSRPPGARPFCAPPSEPALS